MAAYESWACRVSWKELCPNPEVQVLYVCRRATALTSRLSLWVAGTVKKNIFVFMVRGQKLTKHLRVKFLLKTDGGYPKDAGVFFRSPWQTLGVLSALTPIFFVTTKNY